MNRRDAMTGTLGSLIAATLWPGRASSMIFARGAVASSSRPLGLQPSGPSAYYDTEMPYLNILKRAGISTTYKNCPWYTSTATTQETSEEQYVQLDSNGYPTSLVAANVGNGTPSGQTFDRLRMLLFLNQPAVAPGQSHVYAPGTYRLKFIGQGTLVVHGDASLTLSNASSNTYVTGTFTVTTPTSSPGLLLDITAITSGTDYPRDISIVNTAYTAEYDAGEIFDPTFLAVYAGIKCVRGMQWQKQDNIYAGFFSSSFTVGSGATSATLPGTWTYLSGTYPIWFNGGQSVQATCTYGSANVTWTGGLASATPAGSCVGISPPQGWANRCPTTYVSYSMHPAGAPEEIVFALANKLNCDAWVSVRIDADDNYINQLCALAQSSLNQKLYVELSNEVWNGTYWQSFLAQAFGAAQWPAQANDFQQNRNWYGMRSAVISELCATAFGANFSSKCVPVLGCQLANTGTITQSLNTVYWTSAIDGYTGPASAHKLKAVAGAPYWGAKNTTADATAMLAVTTPLDDFFACMTGNVGTVANGSHTYTSVPSGGWLGQVEGWITNALSTLSPYGLPLVGYEGGDNFFADDSVVSGYAALVTSAERDARMGTYYQQFLEWWGTNVGATDTNILVLYSGPRTPQSQGCFGVVESTLQTLSPLASAPAKWQAMQNYISGH